MNKHYINETGTDLLFDTGVDISTAANLYVKYSSPAGTTGTWVGTAYSSTSEITGDIGTYFVQYRLLTADFDIAGEWEFQALVAAADGTWYGETAVLQVYNEFE